MICVLSTPDMCPIWERAVSSAALVGQVRVVEMPPDPRALVSLLEGCRHLVVDLRGRNPRFSLAELPDSVSLESSTFIGSKDLDPNWLFSGKQGCSLEFDFDVERYGARSVLSLGVYCGKAGYDGESKTPLDFNPTHGPGVKSDGLVLWDPAAFVGLGTRVSRDSKIVIDQLYRASVGAAPLWVQPTFPFLIPASPPVFTDLTGESVQGLLCTSLERGGGWVVLTRRDVLTLLGHPGDVPWSRIPSLIGVEAATALLGWVARTFPNPV